MRPPTPLSAPCTLVPVPKLPLERMEQEPSAVHSPHPDPALNCTQPSTLRRRQASTALTQTQRSPEYMRKQKVQEAQQKASSALPSARALARSRARSPVTVLAPLRLQRGRAGWLTGRCDHISPAATAADLL